MQADMQQAEGGRQTGTCGASKQAAPDRKQWVGRSKSFFFKPPRGLTPEPTDPTLAASIQQSTNRSPRPSHAPPPPRHVPPYGTCLYEGLEDVVARKLDGRVGADRHERGVTEVVAQLEVGLAAQQRAHHRERRVALPHRHVQRGATFGALRVHVRPQVQQRVGDQRSVGHHHLAVRAAITTTPRSTQGGGVPHFCCSRCHTLERMLIGCHRSRTHITSPNVRSKN